MPDFIASFLQRFDDLRLTIQQRRSAIMQPQQNRVITYRNSENNPEKKAIPLFGSDSGFGEDWAGQPKIRGIGSVPPPDKPENVSGFVKNWEQNLALPSMPSHGRRLNYDTVTDQKPLIHFAGDDVIGDRWDGVVRNTPKKNWETSRPSGEKTLGDLAAEDLRHYDFDFSS